MRARWLIVVGLFVGALVWLWRSARDAPVAAERSDARRAPAAPLRRTALVPEAAKARLVLPPRQSTFDASSYHTADPCTAPSEPVIPSTFETITSANITVAWDPAEVVGPYDAPFRPVALAFTVAGVLEEAAQLTGTDRRETLTVIVDASLEDFQTRNKTPTWVTGLYDGAAVHLAAKPNADLGVVMSTLRHEVMHAQMHATIGCTPFWFNEGMATYFAGATPTREWVMMMRTGEPFDMTALGAPAILDVKAEDASRMYAVSLAMVLYIVHHAGEVGLREAVRLAQSAESIPAALDLWNRTRPNVDYRAVLDSLAQKVFELPLGPELDAIVRGPLCCHNLRTPADLACRAPAAETTRREICRRY